MSSTFVAVFRGKVVKTDGSTVMDYGLATWDDSKPRLTGMKFVGSMFVMAGSCYHTAETLPAIVLLAFPDDCCQVAPRECIVRAVEPSVDGDRIWHLRVNAWAFVAGSLPDGGWELLDDVGFLDDDVLVFSERN